MEKMMQKVTHPQQSQIERAEAYVREALSRTSKKPVAEEVIRSVAKKVAKAIPARGG
jgi:hypothetical protein